MQLQGAAGTSSVCKSSITGTIRQIFQKEGLRGFYRGIVPEYLKVVPSVGIAFMTYETLKSLLSSIDEDDESWDLYKMATRFKEISGNELLWDWTVSEWLQARQFCRCW